MPTIVESKATVLQCHPGSGAKGRAAGASMNHVSL